jgi:hypothetical protein
MAAGAAVWFVAFWYALPLVLRSTGPVDRFEGVEEPSAGQSGSTART